MTLRKKRPHICEPPSPRPQSVLPFCSVALRCVPFRSPVFAVEAPRARRMEGAGRCYSGRIGPPGHGKLAMLNALSVRNIVLIDQLDLALDQGMTVLTGETGAGKSILLDALTLALGGRGDASLVRQGQESG